MDLNASLIRLTFVVVTVLVVAGILRLTKKRRNAVISQAEFNNRLKNIDKGKS